MSHRDDHDRETSSSERNEDTVRSHENAPQRNEKATSDNELENGDGSDTDDGRRLSGSFAIAVAVLVGIAVATLAYWWVGGWAGNEVFFEELPRVQPTVANGGVGSDWVSGNTVPWLDALIAITHAADVLMGVLILAMVFLHWTIFHRLADRIQGSIPADTSGNVATDGGDRATDRTSENPKRGGSR